MSMPKPWDALNRRHYSSILLQASRRLERTLGKKRRIGRNEVSCGSKRGKLDMCLAACGVYTAGREMREILSSSLQTRPQWPAFLYTSEEAHCESGVVTVSQCVTQGDACTSGIQVLSLNAGSTGSRCDIASIGRTTQVMVVKRPQRSKLVPQLTARCRRVRIALSSTQRGLSRSRRATRDWG